MNCSGCGATLRPVGNRSHFQCGHCGSFHFPEPTDEGVVPLGDPTRWVCPVCVLPLQSALIDGEAVIYCDQCRGFATTMGSFGRIVNKRRTKHSPQEKVCDPFDPEELQHGVKCPGCQKEMDRHPYYGGGNAVVDTCDLCNLIWLDAGELGVIERYVPEPLRYSSIASDSES